MKNIVLILIGLVFVNPAICQTQKANNGYNLKEYCPPSECLYFKFKNSIKFPENEETEWEMDNAEIAIKHNGSYVITGDLDVKGEEMGAKLKFEVVLYNTQDVIIHTIETPLIEYYSDPNYAEPLVISGKIDSSIAEQMDFLDFLVFESETLPYYELSTDCYGPCNNHQLNSSIKAFRKSK